MTLWATVARAWVAIVNLCACMRCNNIILGALTHVDELVFLNVRTCIDYNSIIIIMLLLQFLDYDIIVPDNMLVLLQKSMNGIIQCWEA